MKTVGILGGGQLARMMILAGAPLGLRFRIYDPSPEACAGQLAPLVTGQFDDLAALQAFAGSVDVITFDFENVPAASVAALSALRPVFPNAGALDVAQDRLSEKQLFQALGIALPAFADIDSLATLQARVAEFGMPCILKTRRLGYDGKGQFRIRSQADIGAAWHSLGAQVDAVGLILEGFVDFDCELRVVAARNAAGQFVAWPVTRNWHVDGVLSASLAPCGLPAAVQERAVAHARAVAEHLDYVGVFALELFHCDGALLVNEMAPRVHNSGHWTGDGAQTSQFANHLRAGLGLPLGDTAVLGVACMLNWLGQMPEAAPVLAQAAGFWHDYGKQPRAGRKVGHANFRTDDAPAMARALQQVGQALGREAQVAPLLDALSVA